jgi:phthalate 4,5-dioxygenase oxygenase subunit
MGDLMRSYWVPAAASSEVAVGGAPLRLLLLGEKLVAFRDATGRVGVLDHLCPHRCASLFLGRNEPEGIRCVYHGMQFDVDGNCIDMPNVPADRRPTRGLKAKAYPVVERMGAVWVYMGNSEVPPPFPRFEILGLPDDEVSLGLQMRPCNYLQVMEATLDTTHLGFLHGGTVDATDLPTDHPMYESLANRSAEYKVWNTPLGVAGACHRSAVSPHFEGQTYYRMAQFLLPFWVYGNAYELQTAVQAFAFVPMDDQNCLSFWWSSLDRRTGKSDPVDMDGAVSGTRIEGLTSFATERPNSTGWTGRWRFVENESNDWQIDRDVQMAPWPEGSFTGLDGIGVQDAAVVEGMGPIVDHSREHLCETDKQVIATRRRLLEAAYALREKDETPPGVEQPSAYAAPRGGYYYADPALSPRDAYELNLQQANRVGAQGSDTEG